MLTLVLLLSVVAAMNIDLDIQTTLTTEKASWTLELSRTWDVLGPFPIHAREQHFLSPSFPINISEPLDLEKTYPSAYADNGTVGWSTAEASAEGNLAISFPDIRWSELRATEGWSALQHHAVLHTTLTAYPPIGVTNTAPPRLILQLIQGAYVTILDSKFDSLEAPKTIPPTQDIKLTIDIEAVTPNVHLEPSQNVICDFIDGHAFGDALGVGLHSVGGWWTVLSAKAENFSLELTRKVVLAPSQSRIVPLRVLQTAEYPDSTLNITLVVASNEGREIEVAVTLAVNQLTSDAAFIFASHFAAGVPMIFTAISPISESSGPPILALHGAGVDIVSNSFWAEALPRQQDRWIVAPSGRTAWGLDWHGPSALEAWACVDSLVSILRSSKPSMALEYGTPVLLLGHSNGGQGSWYLASRFPDRVIGVIPQAAYIKSQAYVPLTMSRSAHFIDPAVRAILETSLTPDDNDLFLSNLVDTPILALHGGADDNVPVWHSRETLSVLKTWDSGVNATFREDPGMPHWYPDIMINDRVQSFIDQVFSSQSRAPPNTFTLTVAIPTESGSLHGFTIECLTTPGRLARLTVHVSANGQLQVSSTNVQRFSIASGKWNLSTIVIDNSPLLHIAPDLVTATFERLNRKSWKLADAIEGAGPQPSGRMQSFLTSKAPYHLLVLDGSNTQHLSLALRIAHDLNTYHRLDSEIHVGPTDIAQEGNILVIAHTSDPRLAELLRDQRTPFKIENKHLALREAVFDEPGLGILFLHPHPQDPKGQMLFLLCTDDAGLERAGKLFPIRTGVTVPDWLVISSRADQMGAGGIIGAGVYGNNWSYNDVASWLY
ncbi:hypothetical protein MIND_01064200 [Mycena indigotica]|uniref:Peptidase S9 prolyl oligopeptidase catalytic domain-containing protein n=1 Tax=Mycena indigotica TaxID=2126181 RepID=A0A8H6SAC8_9AGAR|nr:uncharacterized protein MIND_01064200 [Mycena indigotica]KAF7295253.1 hypothetical protein MIND_01064200 [Mycena indigotica]